MPFSPRWLVKVGKYDKAKKTLAWLRKRSIDDPLVEAEFLEIRAEALFEQRVFEKNFPKLAAKVSLDMSPFKSSFWTTKNVLIFRTKQEKQSAFVREVAGYVSLVRSKDNMKRAATAWLVMFWQQWTGIDSSMTTRSPFLPLFTRICVSCQLTKYTVIYYASSVFQSYGFSEGTTAELATGVTGSVFLASTIPGMVRNIS